MPSEVMEVRGKLDEANAKLNALYEESKDEDGVMRRDNIRSVADPVAELLRLNTEQADLAKQLESAVTFETQALEAKETRDYLESINEPVNRPNLGAPGGGAGDKTEPFRSLGERYTDSDEWKSIRQHRQGDGAIAQFDIGIRELLFGGIYAERRNTRALFDNSDFDPYEEQSMLISDHPWGGPRMFVAALPQVPISTDTAQFYRKTTRTEPSDYSLAEGAVYPEGTIEYTRDSQAVIARGWYVPVTDWAEEDSPAAIMDIDRDLIMGIARRIAEYATTTLLGQAGRTTLSAGGESATSAIYKMITKLRVDADTEPNLIVMHPNDWANIVTEQASTGDYLFSGMANSQIMMMRWGLPVIPDVGVTEGRVLVLDSNAVRLRDRRSVNVRTADRWRVASALTVPTGQMLHFADARFAFYAVYRQGIGDLTL